MEKQYGWVEPDETRKEMLTVLVKALGRSLTDQEVRKIHWFGDCDYETRGVLMDLFKEMAERIEYFKEV